MKKCLCENPHSHNLTVLPLSFDILEIVGKVSDKPAFNAYTGMCILHLDQVYTCSQTTGIHMLRWKSNTVPFGQSWAVISTRFIPFFFTYISQPFKFQLGQHHTNSTVAVQWILMKEK